MIKLSAPVLPAPSRASSTESLMGSGKLGTGLCRLLATLLRACGGFLARKLSQYQSGDVDGVLDGRGQLGTGLYLLSTKTNRRHD